MCVQQCHCNRALGAAFLEVEVFLGLAISLQKQFRTFCKGRGVLMLCFFLLHMLTW